MTEQTVQVAESLRSGHIFRSYVLPVPWDHEAGPTGPLGQLEIFAREVSRPDKQNAPWLVYLQGGPGCPSPRPESIGGWLGYLTEHFRVLLLDQRGTGRSTRIDSTTVELGLQGSTLTAEHLRLLRADSIVRDCELLRQALGVERWWLLGQSFGGFCIATYLSFFPDSIQHALITGGVPGMGLHADDVYRATYAKLQARHERFYQQFPWAEERIRQICAHLDEVPEFLPTGERLSSRRFRTIGIELGRTHGFNALGFLLEAPFYQAGGRRRLRQDFLLAVGNRVSFAANPLYAVIHESIYGGVDGTLAATDWSAHRIREEYAGFSEHADPAGAGKFYLTGEHIYPWLFEEDPALVPFKDLAQELAEYRGWGPLYKDEGLAAAPSVAAQMYLDDIFVPFELSQAAAQRFADLRPVVTNAFEHNGIAVAGADIMAGLVARIRDH